MEPVSLREILNWTEGYPLHIRNELFFENISTDSRSGCRDSLFIALKGKNFDGHDFAYQAIKAGARAAVVSRALRYEFPQIVVRDTIKALGDIARNYRRRFHCSIIGITGSDGKTTTKEMCSHLLSYKLNVCKNQGNFNNEIGLPLSIFSITEKTDVGVFELGMNGYGQLKYLGSILQPDIVIITSVGYAHIGFFESRAGIAKAKSEILENISVDGLVLLNGDTDFFRYFEGRTIFPPVKAGMNRVNDFCGMMTDYDGESFVLQVEGWEKIKFRIMSWNGSIVYPALFSIFIADYFGVPRNSIAKLIQDFILIGGRGIVKEHNGIRIIDESYNANPGSMNMALNYFAMQKAKRKIAVIGAMAELGKWSRFYHKKIAKTVRNLKFDAVFTTGQDASIISEFCGQKGKHFENISDLAQFLCGFVQEGDAILIKGSRINKLEQVFEKLTN